MTDEITLTIRHIVILRQFKRLGPNYAHQGAYTKDIDDKRALQELLDFGILKYASGSGRSMLYAQDVNSWKE